ncbi:NUDIX domain-containing protein [Candidatus Saccharibacteria bacterium]|nr:NUDIX domain-containing protein [Candidatus Saccharibacteria bacterium]
MTKIVIVDEKDEVIGAKKREEVDENREIIYRVAALWLVNSRGELLVARRAYSKSHHPGRLACSAAGTVEEGESYLENIVKEAEEELGVSGVEFEELFKDFRDGNYRHFTQWYVGRCEWSVEEFKVDEREVAEIFWMKYKDVVKDFEENADGWVGAGRSLEEIGKWLAERKENEEGESS